MVRDEILPEMLAAAGVCAEFCARPEVWPAFEDWLREDTGNETDDQTVNREFLLAASRVLLMLIRQIETELIARKFHDLLSEN